MLTARTSAQIHTNRHRRDFRLCPASTGAPRARAGLSLLDREWRRLCNAESRRLWLDDRWSAHLRLARSKRVRRRP